MLVLLLPATLLTSAALLWLATQFVRGLRRPKKFAGGHGTPLRVGFLHPDFGIGGSENLVMNAMLALQRKGMRVTMFTAHHDTSHCFEETRGDGPLATCVRVHGDWLPRTILGKMYAFCVVLRILFVTLVVAVKYADSVDAFFVDQLSVSIPFLRALGKPVFFYGHFPDKVQSVDTGSALKAIYRLPFDYLEEITTGRYILVPLQVLSFTV